MELLVDKENTIKSWQEVARVLRHVARHTAYVPRFQPLTPEKRAYMKRFGSRAKKGK